MTLFCMRERRFRVKKKLLILTAIFLLFLIPGLLFNFQRGIYLYDEFWIQRNGGFVSGLSRIDVSGDPFVLTHDGTELQIAVTRSVDRFTRFDFSDGTAIELMPEEPLHIVYSVGDMLWLGDDEIILTDVSHPSRTYVPRGETIVEYYTDEGGAKVGEIEYYLSETGEILMYRDWLYSAERPADPEFISLYDGIRLTYDDVRNNFYVNNDGDVLVNAENLFSVPLGYRQISKRALAELMTDAAEGRVESRGSAWIALAYAVFYWLGAATLLWPEKLAFFGSRWRFYSEPELSDAGLMAEYFSGVVIMITSVAVLFLPFFV